MWKTQIEYFRELCIKLIYVNISLLHMNKVYKGYIVAICDDGIFMSSEMGSDDKITAWNVEIYIPYNAIASVERGL